MEATRARTVDELREEGRAARQRVPRRHLGSWAPPDDRADPVEILRAEGADRLPAIAPIRLGRMAVDPFAFLRGGAGIFAADVAPSTTSGIGVWACGDAHLANFGLFATTERNLVFDINDFDEAHPGAWEWDLRRLVASLVVAARVNGQGEAAGREAAGAAVRAYARRCDELAELSGLERRYLRLDVDDVLALARSSGLSKGGVARAEQQVERARRRDRFHALGRFTEVRDGRRVLVEAPPLVQRLPPDRFRDGLLELWDEYRASVPPHVGALLEQYRFVDLALKVVGVGSVGTRAAVVLLSGVVGDDPLFLQIKEAGRSVLEPWAPVPGPEHAGRRVVEGQRLLQAAGDLFLGWGATGGREYYVRQLRDMKGGIDLAALRPAGFVRYAGLCATALAQAHGRTAHPARIAGYLGRGEPAVEALTAFAVAYADQTERDHAVLVEAIRRGRVEAIEGV
ncbi:MAG: DUF2252 domain-containing protein [Acidimicrobiales bacterium]